LLRFSSAILEKKSEVKSQFQTQKHFYCSRVDTMVKRGRIMLPTS